MKGEATVWVVSPLLLVTLVAASQAAPVAMDSSRGEVLFQTLSCVGCHNINGRGGKTAPDLGRTLDRNFTPASLASTMWNHAPTMWASMRDQGVRAGDLNEQAAADLFAYFYSVRFFEKPGDAGRGKRLFSSKRCADCHGLTEAGIAGAKPVSQWESMTRPVALVNAMWTHAATMRQEFARRKIPAPELTSQEFADILVYLRSLPTTLRQPDLFVLSSGEKGEGLFRSKGCASCHSGNLTLGPRLRGQTLTDVAVDMWNHSPRMAGVAPSMDVLEMRDLTSYLWAQQFFEDSGNAAAGKRVFAQKHCASCHEDASSGAPKLNRGQGTFSGAKMVSILWRHGPRMMEQMKNKALAWPRFTGLEMSNLIAYLNDSK